MKKFYVICYEKSIWSSGRIACDALVEFNLNDFDPKLELGDRKIPEFLEPDEAILWFEELKVRFNLEKEKYNNSKRGFFSYPITDNIDGDIYIIQKVKF